MTAPAHGVDTPPGDPRKHILNKTLFQSLPEYRDSAQLRQIRAVFIL